MPSRARLLSSDRMLRVFDRDARCFSEDSELGLLFAWTNMDEDSGWVTIKLPTLGAHSRRTGSLACYTSFQIVLRGLAKLSRGRHS